MKSKSPQETQKIRVQTTPSSQSQPPTPSVLACRYYFQKGLRTAFGHDAVPVSDVLLPLLLAETFQSFQTECEYQPLSPCLSGKVRVMPLSRPAVSRASLQTRTTAVLLALKFWYTDSLFRALFTVSQPFPLSFSILPSEGPEKGGEKTLTKTRHGLRAASGIPGLVPALQSGQSGSRSILLAVGKEEKSDNKTM